MPSLVDSMRLKADQAALEADKLIRIRREQGGIDQLRRDIKMQMDALGQAALTAYRAGEIAHPQLVSVCQQVDALNEQIAQREARIEQIRAEKLATPLVAAPAVQTGAPCPSCKQMIPEGAAFCPVCGYKVPKAPPAEAVCPSCGSPIPAAAQFCPGCGARKAPAPQTIRCTGCGTELPATALFCPDCGTRVGAAASATPPATPMPLPVTTAPVVVAPIIPEQAMVTEETEAIPELESEAALPIDEPVEALAPFMPEAALPPDEPAEVVVPVASEAAPEPLTKLCSSCQAELPIEAIFCPDCGARQQAP